MFNLVLSAFSGVLASKLIDNKLKKRQYWIYAISIVILISLSLIYCLLGDNVANPFYKCIKSLIEDWDKNIVLQSISLACVIIAIVIVDRKKSGLFTFKEYSTKIYHFTEQVRDGSNITLIAGDMDFWGRVQVDNGKTHLMVNNNEYRQLINCKKKINRLKILCNNNLDSGNLNAIVTDITNAEIFYNHHRKSNNLNDSIFQQLLRIGKIKSDFGDTVEIRFYKSEEDDKRLRARFIDQKGIVYRREGEKSKIKFTDLFKAIKGGFKGFKERLSSLQVHEELYSVNYLSSQEFEIYKDVFESKWKSSDTKQCEKIVTFCESLYHYVMNDVIKYKMALVYVNSYEIARKGEKRKEFPPFGVLYLAASVKKEREWKVSVISVDENTKNEELNWLEYDVIGFSIVSSYSYGILKKCYAASEKRRDVVILAGGYQAERFSNEVFRDFEAHLIFKGEGEDSIREFCHHYKDRNFAAIKGIIYRDNRGNIVATEGRGIVDIDKISEPSRELLPTDDIVMKDRLAGTDRTMVQMLFSRGCPYNCYYCAANQNGNNKNIRYRDKRKIVNELMNLKNIYGIEGFSIIDDCFLTNKKKAIEICECLYKSKLGLVWSLASRVDHIDDQVLQALKDSGCIEIKFGVETGSDTLLKNMNKGVTVAKAEDAIKKTKEKGIGVKLFIITGLPGETDKTHSETKKFLERMAEYIDRVSVLRYTPLAGSYIYNHPEAYGINSRMLKIENFDKMSLYRKSHDWWLDKKRLEDSNKWYNDLQAFVEEKWKDY